MGCLLSTESHRPGLSVGKDDIAGGLRSLGLEAGALVLVHSSLSSLGHVRGGAGAVVRALLEVVGPQGTLVLPAFVGPGEVWEGLETPTTMGGVPSAFLRLPNIRRSGHPTHSVAVQGPLAEELVRDHPLGPAMGPGSPFHRLLERDAWVLLLGVDCQTSAMMHLPEQDLGLPKIGTRVVEIREPDGQVVSLTLEGAPGCSRGFYKLEPILRERDLLREGTIGLAHVMLMRSQDLYRVEMGGDGGAAGGPGLPAVRQSRVYLQLPPAGSGARAVALSPAEQDPARSAGRCLTARVELHRVFVKPPAGLGHCGRVPNPTRRENYV